MHPLLPSKINCSLSENMVLITLIFWGSFIKSGWRYLFLRSWHHAVSVFTSINSAHNSWPAMTSSLRLHWHLLDKCPNCSKVENSKQTTPSNLNYGSHTSSGIVSKSRRWFLHRNYVCMYLFTRRSYRCYHIRADMMDMY